MLDILHIRQASRQYALISFSIALVSILYIELFIANILYNEIVVCVIFSFDNTQLCIRFRA
ncbi:hypothetical protein GCM10027278_28780 [Paralcaligenes ginsengisoli]